MYHISEHFVDGTRFEETRPDFFVIKYMRSKGLLSEEDYASAMAGTERPKIDGLVSDRFRTPEMRDKERRDRTSVQVYNLGVEERRRRRMNDKKGLGKSHRLPS